MKTKLDALAIKDLVALRKEEMAKANPEYQRGVVWKPHQQMKLIDSVLRGYQLPIIYLHKIKKTVAGMTQERYEIIDGQQRIEALYLFVEGAFALFKPDDPKAKFPKFLQEQPCPWGGKYFYALSEELQNQLLGTPLSIAFIETDSINEVRDLFVRLQTGLPLNSQEKRDSYPGQFNDFILRLGGKPQIAKYPGHEFFTRVLKMQPGDRGKTRQLAAQIAILFLERQDNDMLHFTDINNAALDEYYHAHLDFDSSSDSCRRLDSILDKLTRLFESRKRPKLRAHEAIHLVLFVDSIWDDYTRAWESRLVDAQDEFRGNLRMPERQRVIQLPKRHGCSTGYGPAPTRTVGTVFGAVTSFIPSE